MRHISYPILSIILILLLGCTPSNQLTDPQPYFTAIIVRDIDTSIQWYSKQLGFELIDRTDIEARGLSLASLKRGQALIELIKTSTTIYPEDVLADKSKPARLAGYFKFGFAVSNFDEWVAALQKSGAEFHGDVVQDRLSGKRMVIIKDPDGNRIQLFER